MPTDEAKTEAILKSALELFVEKGFHGTPVPLIAENAGVGAGTIYRSFESKEALVNALYQRWKQEVVDRMVKDFPATSPPREQFRIIWERMTDFALRPSGIVISRAAPSRHLFRSAELGDRAWPAGGANRPLESCLEPRR